MGNLTLGRQHVTSSPVARILVIWLMFPRSWLKSLCFLSLKAKSSSLYVLNGVCGYCLKKWVDIFNKLKMPQNIISLLVIVTQTFHFGEWPYRSSLQDAGWRGVSLLTFLTLLFLLTYPLNNQFLHRNSSYFFLDWRVCLEVFYWDLTSCSGES